jgi:hypothetical protein
MSFNDKVTVTATPKKHSSGYRSTWGVAVQQLLHTVGHEHRRCKAEHRRLLQHLLPRTLCTMSSLSSSTAGQLPIAVCALELLSCHMSPTRSGF